MEHSPGFLQAVEKAKPGVREISIDEALGRQKAGAILLDVREDSEWEKGRIPGSKHLGRGVLDRDIEKQIPDKAQELMLMCSGGYRSILAAKSLQEMGYTNVCSIEGGIKAYSSAGKELESGT